MTEMCSKLKDKECINTLSCHVYGCIANVAKEVKTFLNKPTIKEVLKLASNAGFIVDELGLSSLIFAQGDHYKVDVSDEVYALVSALYDIQVRIDAARWRKFIEVGFDDTFDAYDADGLIKLIDEHIAAHRDVV